MTQKDGEADRTQVLVARVRRIFALRPDTDYDGTLVQVRADVEFHSGNVWALVFAILIASVGLNVNSTAVIIGAMLISPLMGPIVGAGFGLATNDFALLRRGGRNLLLAVAVALATSALYFLVSPLEVAQSELLSRTRPTLYDVLIALFGGGAGAVAVSRKDNKSHVVPGVAIATALMPPLCTAGFALAHGNGWYLLGALHLFLINALFVCLATLGFARLMHFERVVELDPQHRTRARTAMVFVTLGIALPSVYTGWSVVRETRFQQAARRFIAENLEFTDRALVNVQLRYAGGGSTIHVTLLGHPLAADAVHALEARLPAYGLDHTRLLVSQPVAGQASVEQVGQLVRQGVLEDLFRRNEAELGSRDARIRVLEDEVARLRATDASVRDLTRELVILHPTLVSLGVGREVRVTPGRSDSATTVFVVASWRSMPPAPTRERLRAFLALRLGVDSLRLVNAVGR